VRAISFAVVIWSLALSLQAKEITSLVVTPSPPKSSDQITVTASGYFPALGYLWMFNCDETWSPCPTNQGNHFYVEMWYAPPGGDIFLPALEYWEADTVLPPLPSGGYHFTFTTRNMGGSEMQSKTISFVVDGSATLDLGTPQPEGQGPRFEWWGHPNARYSVQLSTNMPPRNWKTVASFTTGSGSGTSLCHTSAIPTNAFGILRVVADGN
jgi:hypothetical protein